MLKFTFSLLILFGLFISISVYGEKVLGRSEVIPSDMCGASVISYEDERLFVFALSEDSVVWFKSQRVEGGWTPWKTLGERKRMSSGPIPIRHTNGTLQVFARGIDRRYYVSTMFGEDWTNWKSAFGNMTFSSPPVPVIAPSGSCLLFGVSADTQSVWYSESRSITYHNIDFSPWANLGGNSTSPPTIIVDAEALLHVFIRGANRALWHLAETYSYPGPKKWADWECLGGVLASSPKTPSVINGANLIEVYTRAADKSLWYLAQTATQQVSVDFPPTPIKFSPWSSLGGILASGVSVVNSDDGMTEIFTRSTDLSLYYKNQYEDSNGEFHYTPWSSLGGMFSTTPTVVIRSDGFVNIFVRGVDKAVWYSHQVEVNGTRSFSSWHSLGGHTRKFTCS